jgi:hypothetical protein
LDVAVALAVNALPAVADEIVVACIVVVVVVVGLGMEVTDATESSDINVRVPSAVVDDLEEADAVMSGPASATKAASTSSAELKYFVMSTTSGKTAASTKKNGSVLLPAAEGGDCAFSVSAITIYFILFLFF